MGALTQKELGRIGCHGIGEALAEVYMGAREATPMFIPDGLRHEVGIAAVNAYGRSLGFPAGAEAFTKGVIQMIGNPEEGDDDA